MAVRPLRQILSVQSVLVVVVPALISALFCLVWIVPQIDSAIEARQRQLASAVASQVDQYLSSAYINVRCCAALATRESLSREGLDRALDMVIEGSGSFGALYVVKGDRRVMAVGLPKEMSSHRQDLLGLDLSRNPLLAQVLNSRGPVWSDTFLSVVGGGLSVATAVPMNGMVFIGEVELRRLSAFLNHIVSDPGQVIFVLDRHGQVLADQNGRYTAQQLNLSNIALVKKGLTSASLTGSFELDDRPMIGTMITTPSMPWSVLVAQRKDSVYRAAWSATTIATGGFLLAALLAINAALYNSRKLSQRFEQLASRARSIARCEQPPCWQQGEIAELEQVAEDLQRMAEAIQAREWQLIESRRLIQSVMDNSFGLQWLLTPDGKVVDANKTALELIGKPKGAVVGCCFAETPWWEHDAGKKGAVCEAIARLSAGGVVRFEFGCLDMAGCQRIIDFSLKTLQGEHGEVIYLIAEGHDITERKSVEQKLEREKYFADTVIESMPVIFYVHDGKKFVRWNSALEQASGLSAVELQDTAPLDLIYSEDQEYTAQKLAEALETGQAEGEARVVTRSGIQHHFMTGRRMPVDGVSYIVGASMDISERKEMERIKDEMLSAVSHEMRTPLTAMLGYLDFILENEVDESQIREYLGVVFKETNRLNDLISDFLDLQRLRARDKVQNVQPLPVVGLLQEAIALFACVSEKHRLAMDETSETLQVLGNEEDLLAVLKNLLSNAVKYSPAGGAVRVGARQEGESITLWVRDEGIGIAAEEQEKIFSRFYRIDNTARRTTGGTGLGLALVWEIVQGHGGRVWVESVSGEGSTFFLSLPAAQSEASSG